MRNKILAALGVVLAIAAVILFGFDVSRQPDLNYFAGHDPLGGDFTIFWPAARLVYEGEAIRVYDPAAIGERMKEVLQASFRPVPLFHPPHLLPFLAPFGAMPYFAAYVGFFAVTFLFFLSAVWRWGGRWLTLFMMGFSGVWLTLVTGQVGLLYAGLFGWGMWFLSRRPLAAGGFIALLTIKPQLGLMWPVALVAGRQGKALLATVAAFALIVVGIALAYGGAIWAKGLEGMLYAGFGLGEGGNAGHIYKLMPSVFSALRLAGVSAAVAFSVQGAIIMVVGYYSYKLWRLTTDAGLRMALLALANLVSAPFIYNYDLALLAWPIVVLLMQPKLRWYEYAVVAIAYIWPMLNFRMVGYTGYQVGMLLPVLMLVVIARRIVQGARVS